MSPRNIYKWYRDFKEGRECVDDLQRSGRSSALIDDQNINKIKEMVLGNRRLTPIKTYVQKQFTPKH